METDISDALWARVTREGLYVFTYAKMALESTVPTENDQ